jgi:hypothetical protein
MFWDGLLTVPVGGYRLYLWTGRETCPQHLMPSNRYSSSVSVNSVIGVKSSFRNSTSEPSA